MVADCHLPKWTNPNTGECEHPLHDETFDPIGVNQLDNGEWLVWCDVCDKQIGSTYPTAERAALLADAHNEHHERQR